MLQYAAFHQNLHCLLIYNRSFEKEIHFFGEIVTCDSLIHVYTVKPVLSGHSYIDKTKVLKTGDSLVQVESIAECSHSAILLTCIK